MLGRDLTSYDAVILQRKLLPQWMLARLRRRVRRLLFDFDDAVWLRDSYSAKGLRRPEALAAVSRHDCRLRSGDRRQ